MFGFLKLFFSLAMILAIAGMGFYFLPASAKIKGTSFIVDHIPNSWKEEANNFLLTPQEERVKLVGELEKKLQIIQDKIDPKDKILVEESASLLAELKTKNTELSFTELAKQKIIDTLVTQKPLTCEPRPDQ